ncbi:ATP-binding protein [Dictyobacter vulcani]|uniref:ATP-binding protein n=1 Tax=Dictyobacter vulcani TaxID=2607529 RepID=A0A5J4KXE6_9CHLR|nr:ATP-binding protein [Dictyobacter vulcani]GER91220.1 ATP-binding protein [Dictyobacter vulcani]
MLLIALKGFSGCGKSTISRALSQKLGWPLIDKDDIRDLLDDTIPLVGGLAYEVMFNVARRQLQQGLSVICDSPLTGSISYERAQAISREAHASLAILECVCSDSSNWEQRINARKTLQLPVHHQTDWHSFQHFLQQPATQESYTITHPHLIIDTSQPLDVCLTEIMAWLERLVHYSA